MSDPLVSIIIPTYNYGHFLEDSLGSILAQTWSQWECIVVDDGSTDDTSNVVDAFMASDSRIKYLHQENAGLSAARNTGIRHAEGRYIQFLDADDLLEPRKLECHVAYLEENPDMGIVYGDVRYFPDNDRSLRSASMDGQDTPWMPKVSAHGVELLRCLIERNIMVASAPLVRREVVEAAGYFDVTLASSEDWDYWLRCALIGTHFSFYAPPATLSLVRCHGESMTANARKMLVAHLMVRKRLHLRLEDLELRRINRERASDTGVELALLSFDNKKRLAGIWEMIRYGVMGYRFDLIPYAFKCALFGR